MTRHVDAETLARYRHEDLRRRRASRVRAHLAGCERCRALDEDLAGVTMLLADAQPPPIPEHLAARIQTALAAEAARRALPARATSTAPGAAAGGEARQTRTEPAETGVHDRRTSRHGRHGRDRTRQRRPGFASPVALRTMAAAAAAVVLAGGGYEIAQHVGGSSSPSQTTAGSPQQPQRGNFSAPAASGALPRPYYLHAGHTDIPLVATNTNYTPATLEGQVRKTLAQYGPLQKSGPSGLRSPVAEGNSSGTFGNIPFSTITGCVTRIAAGQQVLLVDVASYRGTPAMVIVTSAPAGGPEQVWVVGRGCSSTSSNLLTHATLAPAG
jgi:hypothetical protein